MKKILYILFLLILFICISAVSYAKTVSRDLETNFFRLHILANSNLKEDQELKLKVRDNIIEYMNSLSYINLSKEDAIKLTNENLDKIKEIAENTIIQSGYNYTVDVEIGNFYFPTKHYANVSLPAGYYDALRIKIGKAEGENWWCSLFPPLCFTDISSGVIDTDDLNALEENLSKDEFEIITGNNEKITFKFKLVELLS